MSSNPLVSIVTPVYNGESFLEACIESVLTQTYTNYEYIIVNNCSTDRTLDLAARYALQDSRIRVYTNEKFVGVIENHNIAFRYISRDAKYCKVVSADDVIFPDCVMRLVECAEANPSVSMVGSYSLAGKKVMWDGLPYEVNVVKGDQICRATLLGGPYVFGAPTSLLYRADVVRRKRAFYPNSNPHADTTACYESLTDSDFGFVHQVLSYTRVHGESQTSRSLKVGTINLALIGDLVRFGPKYLSPNEQRSRLRVLMESYYRVLVHAAVEGSASEEFWEQQKAALQELGLRFSFVRLSRTAAKMTAKMLSRPGVAMKRILEIKKGARMNVGQYY